MRCGLLSLLALALSPLALADVEFTYPTAGLSIAAGTITVTWAESGLAPAITDLKSYTLSLMVGGNDVATAQNLGAMGTTTELFSTGNTIAATITPTLAQSLTNGFYLQMISTAKDGGTVTNYSPRFTLTGMTGTTAAGIVAQVKALDGSTAGPARVDDVTGATKSASSASLSSSSSSSAVAAVPVRTKTTTTPAVVVTSVAPVPAAEPAEYTVPFNLQTGLIRYAPMQPVPPTRITAKNATPLFPTSAFTIAHTILPPATIQTTLTATQTFSVQSIQNTIAAQSRPTADQAKFLARWKD